MAVVAEVGVQLNSRNAVARLRALETATAKSTKAFNLMGAAVKAIPFIGLADATRRFFQGFAEADKARAAVKSLGVDADALSKKLLGVSNELGGLVSQTELTAAAYDVASAGFTDAGDAAEILKASAQGAVGGLSDLNTVADATTSVLNAYGKSSSEAAKIVDGFVQTQNDGKIIVAQYAQQIGRVAPIAAAAGVGIEELNAAISAVTATGVPVESTFAGLRQAIASVIKPTKEAQDTAKTLGLEFDSAAIKSKGFGGFLEDVIAKTGGSEVALTRLFGSVEAVATVLPLANDNLEKFNTSLDNQKNSTDAAKDATKLLGDTVSSQVTQIINNIGNVARQLDKFLRPVLGFILDDLNNLISAASTFLSLLSDATTGQAFQQLLLANTANTFGAQAEAVDRVGLALSALNTDLVTNQASADAFQATLNRARSALDAIRKDGANALGDRGLLGRFNQLGFQVDDLQRELDKLVGKGFGAGAGGGGGSTAPNPDLQALRDRIAALLAAQDQTKGGAGGKTLKLLESQNNAAKERLFTSQAELAIAKESSDLSRIDLEFDLKRQQTQREYAGLLAKSLSDEERSNLAAALRGELDALSVKRNEAISGHMQDQFDSLSQVTAELTAMDPVTKELSEEFKSLASTINNEIINGIEGMIDGTKTLGQVASSMLKKIASQMLQTAIMGPQGSDGIGGMLLSGLGSIFGGGGGGFTSPNVLTGGLDFSGAFANGGRPPVGKAALVGERGPELFVPSTSGTIVPNGQFGGANVVVNVDASGSSAQGDAEQSKQLGQAIGAAVQAEIIKQQMPGGLLN
jgi:TP901 family phage tail tape measure protein